MSSFELSNRQEVWSTERSHSIWPAYSKSSDLLYVSSENQGLYALSISNGSTIWQHDVTQFKISALSIFENKVIILNYSALKNIHIYILYNISFIVDCSMG